MPTMNGTAWSRRHGPDLAWSRGLINIGVAAEGCHRETAVKVRRALAGLCSDLREMLWHFRSSEAVVRIAKRAKPQSRR